MADTGRNDTDKIIAAIFAASMLNDKSVNHADYITMYQQFVDLLKIHAKKKQEEESKASAETWKKVGKNLSGRLAR